MKIKVIGYVLLLLGSLNSFGQKKFSVDVLTGLGLNNNLSLANEKVNDYTSITTQLNINYTFKLYKKLKAETGVGLQWYDSYGNIGLSKFNSKTLRLNVPLLLVYPISEKVSLTSGIAAANNRDFDEYNIRSQDNFRMSLVIKGSYYIKEDLSLLFKVNRNISNIAKSYFLNQPRTDVLLGIAYKLF